MPTLQRFGRISIRMYADDHRPPHVVGTDFQVMVSIAELSIIAGTARRRQIAQALAWAAEHRDMLARKWVELTERE
jgi:hypothetical protein